MARLTKDSGIPWIGSIPIDWQTVKMKQVADFQPRCDVSGLSADSEITYTPMECIRNGYFVNNTALYGDLPPSLTPYNNGDIVFAKVTPCFENGNIAIMENLNSGFGLGSSELFVVRPREIGTRFLFYWLQNDAFIQQGRATMTGTGGLKRVSPYFVKNCPLPLPSDKEQQSIAAFLDAECARIDAIIEQTRATVEEYKKLKQSIITQAVTKGIRPNRRMKDSGIEWIGEIPDDWEVVKMKRLCKKITDGSHFSPESIEDGYPYITAKDIRGIGIDYGKANKISRDDFETLRSNGCQPHNGDVLIVKDGATTGRVGLMNDDTECVLLSSVAMLTPSENISSLYLMYLLQSYLIQNQIMISMAGSAMPRITLSKLVDFYGIRCPRSDQKEICEYLFKKTAILDGLITQKVSVISCLESYKKSLIYEYVTGKKEVI